MKIKQLLTVSPTAVPCYPIRAQGDAASSAIHFCDAVAPLYQLLCPVAKLPDHPSMYTVCPKSGYQ